MIVLFCTLSRNNNTNNSNNSSRMEFKTYEPLNFSSEMSELKGDDWVFYKRTGPNREPKKIPFSLPIFLSHAMFHFSLSKKKEKNSKKNGYMKSSACSNA